MSAIDFQSIRYTTAGLECYYLGQRRSGDQMLHRFAVVNPACETIVYYNEQGQRIDYVAPGKWVATPTGHQIIAPPKIVEVTRWVGLVEKEHAPGEYYLDTAKNADSFGDRVIAKQQHTFRFEVPNE